MHGHLIKVQNKPLKKYQVQISYFRQQVFEKIDDDKGLFSDWILLEPTAIQASLIDDEDELNTLTENAVIKHTNHMSDEIEDFLRDTKE